MTSGRVKAIEYKIIQNIGSKGKGIFSVKSQAGRLQYLFLIITRASLLLTGWTA